MKTVTVDTIMSWEPCSDYTRERVEELKKSVCGRRKNIATLDIIQVNIPNEDKLWAILRPEFFSNKELHKIAIYIAEKIALPLWEKHCPNDNRPRKAIEAKKLGLKGQITDEELAAACYAARAALDAACYAAWTARDAAGAALDAAWTARDAALSASRDAALSASRAATMDDVNKKILRYIKKMIQSEKE